MLSKPTISVGKNSERVSQWLDIVRNVAFQQRRRYGTATVICTPRERARALIGIYQNLIPIL
ncbi:uncharacterized protein LACBIDRAFT_309895 [Laccaria bicolor S238N-H82]|uniref:Predicted protein n=1 Tax=Laccaria bicolor (strain S238N-H82 / ATCC MYA-4686) TaxID=486041 RepID=B0DTB0_LACBS|nr:uncharacterized protein LACBIDRAFT_309895 [Laccaria bicolor S238N-H82]EDR02189.1 predicted protein [Laccaria bicolor S238N-H82]|eukprot:XP_001887134.1 predicted protein [Laccaria bicolor S238N-H82]